MDVNRTSEVHPSDMTGEVTGNAPATRRLRTRDGVPVQVVAYPGLPGAAADLVFVVVPGFTQSSRSMRIRRIVSWLQPTGAVVQLDLRGHGGSGGSSSVGDVEVLDLVAAVEYARSLGYRRVVTVGFSLGAAVSLRHAALHGEVAAVAAVSTPGEWFYRGTAPMRLLHRGVASRTGRAMLRWVKRTRVQSYEWAQLPLDPAEAAAQVQVPMLVVHGDSDDYFPLHQAWRVHRAGPDSTLWVEPGFGHAEAWMTEELTGRIAGWLDAATADAATATDAAATATDTPTSTDTDTATAADTTAAVTDTTAAATDATADADTGESA